MPKLQLDLLDPELYPTDPLFTSMTTRFTNLLVVSEPGVEANVFARAVRSFQFTSDRRA